jgi:hypothetical protein
MHDSDMKSMFGAALVKYFEEKEEGIDSAMQRFLFINNIEKGVVEQKLF